MTMTLLLGGTASKTPAGLLVLLVVIASTGLVHASSRGVTRELMGTEHGVNKTTIPSVSYVNIKFDSSAPVDQAGATAQSESAGIGSWLDRKKNKFGGGSSSTGSSLDEARPVGRAGATSGYQDTVPVTGAGVSAAGGSGQMDADEALRLRQQLLEELLQQTEQELAARG